MKATYSRKYMCPQGEPVYNRMFKYIFIDNHHPMTYRVLPVFADTRKEIIEVRCSKKILGMF